MIDDDASSYRDVEGVLRTKLGDFEAPVAEVDGFLMDTLDLVAENHSITTIWFWLELMKKGGAFSLLDSQHLVAYSFELFNGIDDRWYVTPADTVLSSKCCLVDFGVWRPASNAAKDYLADTKSIGCTQYRAYIVHGANIVEDNH